MLPNEAQRLRIDRTNTAYRLSDLPQVPATTGSRGAWVPPNSVVGRLLQSATQPVCSVRQVPKRPVHTDPRCELMTTVTPDTTLAIWGALQAHGVRRE